MRKGQAQALGLDSGLSVSIYQISPLELSVTASKDKRVRVGVLRQMGKGLARA